MEVKGKKNADVKSAVLYMLSSYLGKLSSEK